VVAVHWGYLPKHLVTGAAPVYRLPQSRRGLGIQDTHYPLDFPLDVPDQLSFRVTNPSYAVGLMFSLENDLDEDGHTTPPGDASTAAEDYSSKEKQGQDGVDDANEVDDNVENVNNAVRNEEIIAEDVRMSSSRI
jgi:hypothetical protein